MSLAVGPAASSKVHQALIPEGGGTQQQALPLSSNRSPVGPLWLVTTQISVWVPAVKPPLIVNGCHVVKLLEVTVVIVEIGLLAVESM